jgi:signal transduction histidine kinase
LRWLGAEPANVERAKQAVDRMVEDANRASEVISRVRTLAKRTPAQKDWLDINETVLDVITLTKNEFEKNKILLQTRLADDLPRVHGDRIELQQVMLNLIINSIDALSVVREGPRDLTVSSSKDSQGSVSITVQDSGAGFGSAKIDNLFDPFYTTKIDGMGIGLTISRSIIEAHGGRIWATRNEPRGAIFHFSVPVREEPEAS